MRVERLISDMGGVLPAIGAIVSAYAIGEGSPYAAVILSNVITAVTPEVGARIHTLSASQYQRLGRERFSLNTGLSDFGRQRKSHL